MNILGPLQHKYFYFYFFVWVLEKAQVVLSQWHPKEELQAAEDLVQLQQRATSSTHRSC